MHMKRTSAQREVQSAFASTLDLGLNLGLVHMHACVKEARFMKVHIGHKRAWEPV